MSPAQTSMVAAAYRGIPLCDVARIDDWAALVTTDDPT